MQDLVRCVLPHLTAEVWLVALRTRPSRVVFATRSARRAKAFVLASCLRAAALFLPSRRFRTAAGGALDTWSAPGARPVLCVRRLPLETPLDPPLEADAPPVGEPLSVAPVADVVAHLRRRVTEDGLSDAGALRLAAALRAEPDPGALYDAIARETACAPEPPAVTRRTSRGEVRAWLRRQGEAARGGG